MTHKEIMEQLDDISIRLTLKDKNLAEQAALCRFVLDGESMRLTFMGAIEALIAVADELIARFTDDTEVKAIRNVVACYRTDNVPTLFCMQEMRRAIDARTAHMAKEVSQYKEFLGEYYNKMRWDTNFPCTDDEYEKLYDGIIYEADECEVLTTLESVSAFMGKCKLFEEDAV